MKTPLSSEIAHFVVSMSILFMSIAANAQTLAGSTPKIVWGKETNGISAGVALATRCFVYARRRGNPLRVSIYRGPTNSFCGQIELEDARGETISLLDPSVASLESYPESVSLTSFLKSMRRPRVVIGRMPNPGFYGRDFLCESNKTYRMTSFMLNHYFTITNSGSYTLTIWPKIYRQSETNNDLYKRIDVPPVTMSVRLNSARRP